MMRMRISFYFMIMLCPFILGGCIGSILPFGSDDAFYGIEGLEEDQAETHTYLEQIIKDRLQTKEVYDDLEDDEEYGYDVYYEELIRADLIKALKAKGYYSARVIFEDNDQDADSNGIYRVETGGVYSISSISVTPNNHGGLREDIALRAGDLLTAENVLKSQQTIIDTIKKEGCYFTISVEHSVILDKRAFVGEVIYDVDLGKDAVFGDVIFEGQEKVETEYINRLVPWQKGDCFDRVQIQDFRAKLLRTGLFSSADVILPDAPLEDTTVPVTFKLKERAHRSISIGATYYTDEGAGTVFEWAHRNFFGHAETVEASLNLSQQEQSVSVVFNKPYFLREDQSLSLNAGFGREDLEAYEELSFDVGAAINRQFTPDLKGSSGVQLTISEVDDNGDVKTYGLVSFPQSLIFDNRDDTLNPRKGWRLRGQVEPFVDVLGQADPFFKTEAAARTYIDLGLDPDLVLAFRAEAGSILGATNFDIPASERFYAGGGSSVRGFGFQELGPLNDDGDPTGGRSVVTVSSELRFKITDTIGAAAFVDAGTVSQEAFPDFDNFAVGAGAGLRYFTGFGPLRFDVAVPLNQKDELEQNYQIYISIGQAF